MLKKIIIIGLLIIINAGIAQRVGFMSSDMIRDKFPEAQTAEQRIQSVVEEWKRTLQIMQDNIDKLEFEIKKNRLIWTDTELHKKQEELNTAKLERETFAKNKFGPNGEYDRLVKEIMKPVEEKIYAAVHKVSIDQKFDIILDQSIQPIPYANYKYDLTLSILKELGVEVEDMEAQLKEKISKDPRNQKKESKKPTRRRGRRSYDPRNQQNNQEESREFERTDEEPEPSNEPVEEKNPEKKQEVNPSKPPENL